MTDHRFSLLLPLICLAMAPGAHAQPSPPPSSSMPPAGTYEQNEGPPTIEPHQLPAFAISGVEVTQAGALMAIRVRGLTTTTGWREPTLVPLVRRVPSDGVLDMVLVAEPPPQAMPATGFAPVEATLLVAQDHPYRGVRVRSATNVVAVNALPGRADVAIPAEDCRACIGRALGDAAGADVIARGALPKATRVLRPTDPFPDVDPNPNRLTLLIGNDGKVIEAMWQ